MVLSLFAKAPHTHSRFIYTRVFCIYPLLNSRKTTLLFVVSRDRFLRYMRAAAFRALSSLACCVSSFLINIVVVVIAKKGISIPSSSPAERRRLLSLRSRLVVVSRKGGRTTRSSVAMNAIVDGRERETENDLLERLPNACVRVRASELVFSTERRRDDGRIDDRCSRRT